MLGSSWHPPRGPCQSVKLPPQTVDRNQTVADTYLDYLDYIPTSLPRRAGGGKVGRYCTAHRGRDAGELEMSVLIFQLCIYQVPNPPPSRPPKRHDGRLDSHQAGQLNISTAEWPGDTDGGPMVRFTPSCRQPHRFHPSDRPAPAPQAELPVCLSVGIRPGAERQASTPDPSGVLALQALAVAFTAPPFGPLSGTTPTHPRPLDYLHGERERDRER